MNRQRQVWQWVAAVLVVFVALLIANLWVLRHQQSSLEAHQAALQAEAAARARAACEGVVEPRAVTVVFNNTLIAAANAQPDRTAEQLERARAFQRRVYGIMAGSPPAQCDGLMSDVEFRRRVDAAVDELQRQMSDG